MVGIDDHLDIHGMMTLVMYEEEITSDSFFTQTFLPAESLKQVKLSTCEFECVTVCEHTALFVTDVTN